VRDAQPFFGNFFFFEDLSKTQRSLFIGRRSLFIGEHLSKTQRSLFIGRRSSFIGEDFKSIKYNLHIIGEDLNDNVNLRGGKETHVKKESDCMVNYQHARDSDCNAVKLRKNPPTRWD
jgi:hypothetical protein